MAKKKNLKTNTMPASPIVNLVEALFIANPLKAFNFRQISKMLGITDKVSKELVSKVLETMARSGTILELNRGKFKYNPDLLADKLIQASITGIVDMKQTGKAYVSSADLDEDVFIAAGNTGHALHGDKVKVHLFPMRKGRKTEGQIVEVLERGRKQFVGTVQLSGKFAFLVPDDVNMPIDIFIPKESLNKATNGQKAIARITEWPERSKNPFGEITQVLGEPGDNNVEMNSILASFDFPLQFKPETLKEAEKIPVVISEKEIAKRRDFRSVWTCTIDPPDAKDFDDALSLKKLENGDWEVGVHIADVSYYVQPDSALDKEAYDRGTSIYLVDRTIPMLPEKLSNMVCSLRPDEDKLCFSAVFVMNEQAHISSEWFGKTIIRSNRRYAYEEAQAMIDGGDGDFKDEILVLNGLATKLREERFKKGAIAFHSQEVKFILDEKGKPVDTYIKEQKEANMLIEDFMLLANKKVAEKIGKKAGEQKAKTFVYRIHDEPNQEKLMKFVEFLSKLGYKMNIGSRKGLASSFNHLFDQIAGKGEENMIESIAIRTMAKAIYSTVNIGHYGLAFQHYTHFTSPIRRYPDLMVHRLLEWYMEGRGSVNKDEYEEYCMHSSEMEKKAVEAERASVKYKQAEFLADKIGQSFDGLISGVSKWGIFVELEGSKCEGMVSLKYLDDDFYYLDDENYRVIGQHYGREFKLGDKVKVKVLQVDLQKKQMDFVLDAEPVEPMFRPNSKRNRKFK
ncbi:MAG: ribonuclease R [Lentimicrobiaceae bacterium]|nr:ribonuclease R [Lentimicrobiaceae bacterium]MCB9024030.1 ribonuclease R [Lentimicrobiaceae bacterium]MCO5265789.1 ribonuclease R [Lentimicrobium sp.]HPG32497.1 ribonuclease R [Lentimicrobium sp.]